MFNDLKYKEHLRKHLRGKGDNNFNPFNIKVFGAYHRVYQFYERLRFVINGQKLCINNKEITHLSDLIPYFNQYSTGFNDGFNKFEDNIKSYLLVSEDKNDIKLKIFEYLHKSSNSPSRWLFNDCLTLNRKPENFF